MVAALSRAAAAFDESRYAAAAHRCADFLLRAMRDESGRLLHRYRGGDSGIVASADDYAFLSMRLFDLYEATQEARYLREAARLTDEMIELFWDETRGGFFFTPHDGERLLTRRRELYDGAVPSANSIAFLNLLRLGAALARPDLEERASSLAEAFSGAVAAHPSAYTMFLSALDYALGPSVEIVIVGRPEDSDTISLLGTARSMYLPNGVVLLRPPGDARETVDLAPWLESYAQLKGRATAYVCHGHTCGLPLTGADALTEALRNDGTS
jgi:uncharacterized protein YyaL (SSP411 family)